MGKLNLPELVEVCSSCEGWGSYYQRYMEGRFLGPCYRCKGAQFVYKSTGKPVSQSVCNQIAVTNNLVAFRTYVEAKMLPLLGYPDDGDSRRGLDVPWEKPGVKFT